MPSGAAAACRVQDASFPDWFGPSSRGNGSLGLGASAPCRGDGWPVDSALDFDPACEGGLNIIPCARRAELVPLLALPLRFDEVEELVGEAGRGEASTGASELLITVRFVVRGASTGDAGSPRSCATGSPCSCATRDWGEVGTANCAEGLDFLYP